MVLPGHTMASAARGQPLARHTGDIVNAPARPRAQRRRGVRREQLSDEVAAHLRTAIMTGTLRPGTFIRLDETAAALGVSITPVREALRTLRGEGMVQLEPHRGHVVVPLTRGDIEDIFWLQATIAKELAVTAAERITDAQIGGAGTAQRQPRRGRRTRRSRGGRRGGVRFPSGVQPLDRPDQAGLVPVARRAVPAGAGVCQRCGVGRRRGGQPPRVDRGVAPPRCRHRRQSHERGVRGRRGAIGRAARRDRVVELTPARLSA